MKKFLAAICASALILSMTGCNAPSENVSTESGSDGAEVSGSSVPDASDAQTNTSSSTAPMSSSVTSLTPYVENRTDFTGSDGQPVTLTDAVVDAEGRVTFDYSFIKYAPSIYDDSLKNPDLINWETLEFAPYNDTYTPTIKRLKVGDVLENGLKVTKAYETLEFGTYMDEATLETRSGWNVYGGELTFDGELYFFPDTTNLRELPVGCIFTSPENGEYTVFESVYPDAKLAVIGGTMLYLGNISEIDSNGIIEKGKAAEVTVTINNIRITSSNTAYGGRSGDCFADIVSIKKING